ncbi:DNA mismatch repair protein msh6, partial [Cryomyces antarcticus]
MARGIEGNEIATPRPPAKLQKATSSQSNGQKSILGFFSKKAGSVPSPTITSTTTGTRTLTKASTASRSNAGLTPAPSSDPVELSSQPSESDLVVGKRTNKKNGLPSPVTSVRGGADGLRHKEVPGVAFSSPSRRAKKQVTYADDSDDEDDEEDVFKPLNANAAN